MSLISGLLLLWLLLVWGLWVVACVAERALTDARASIPIERRGGVSILPGFPLFPLVAWGLAALGDRFINPYGSMVIAALHGAFGLALLASVLRNRSALRALENRA